MVRAHLQLIATIQAFLQHVAAKSSTPATIPAWKNDCGVTTPALNIISTWGRHSSFGALGVGEDAELDIPDCNASLQTTYASKTNTTLNGKQYTDVTVATYCGNDGLCCWPSLGILVQDETKAQGVLKWISCNAHNP